MKGSLIKKILLFTAVLIVVIATGVATTIALVGSDTPSVFVIINGIVYSAFIARLIWIMK